MLIDSDLASNNGGWQWSSGTGTDPQPYFRIFNPYNQSEKVRCHTPSYRDPTLTSIIQADPTGNYIREFVPELGGLRGSGRRVWIRFEVSCTQPPPDIHKPSPKAAEKLGYPLPLIAHDKARDRALRRYKNPGTD